MAERIYAIRKRKSGRTTRIVNFIVCELISNGEVIATDHSYYDEKHLSSVSWFIAQVLEAINPYLDANKLSFKTEPVTVHGVKMIHFKVYKNE